MTAVEIETRPAPLKAAAAVVALPFFTPYATCYPGVLITDRLRRLGVEARFIPAHVEFYSRFRASGLTEAAYKPFSHDSFAADAALLPLLTSVPDVESGPQLDEVCHVYGLPGASHRQQLCRLFDGYVDQLVDRLVGTEIILSTATHYQLLPTLILARRLKARARVMGLPEPFIVLGGYLGDPGIARSLLEKHPDLDVVVYGEAEDVLERVVQASASRSRQVILGGARSYRTVFPSQLSLVEASRAMPWLRDRLTVSLELSRGCYWDQCDFCNFNASYDMRFKMHKSETVLDEIDMLTAETGQTRYQFLDTALPPRFADVASQHRRDLNVFCEIRPDFGADKLAALAEMGTVSIQIGIETLDEEHLTLMNKNQTVDEGVEMLWVAQKLGIESVWGIMIGHPKETPEIRRRLLRQVQHWRHLGLPAPKYVTECELRPGSGLWTEKDDLGLTLEFPWRVFDEILAPTPQASALVPSRTRGAPHRGRGYAMDRDAIGAEVMAWQADQGLEVGLAGD